MPETSVKADSAVELETMDGRIVTRDDVLSTPTEDCVDDVLTKGVLEYSEVELARLPAETVTALEERIDELSDAALSVLKEVADRGRFYGVFTQQPGGAGQAWYDLNMTILKESRERGYDRSETPMPRYTSVDGVPKSVGNVASRLLSGWVVEMDVMKADAGRNPNVKTIAAEVVRENRLSEETGGWIGSVSSERGWRLEGIGEHEGEVFAMAPLTPGENTTVWVEESFSGEWGDPWKPVSIECWPSVGMYEKR